MNATEISKGGIFGIRSTEISKGIGICNTTAILRFTIWPGQDQSNRLIIITDRTPHSSPSCTCTNPVPWSIWNWRCATYCSQSSFSKRLRSPSTTVCGTSQSIASNYRSHLCFLVASHNSRYLEIGMDTGLPGIWRVLANTPLLMTIVIVTRIFESRTPSP